MPTLQLKLSPPQGPERHLALAKALTQLSSQHLGKRADVTAVFIDNVPTQSWFVGAQELAQPTAWLEISVTAGTNTEVEKSRFIAAAYAELNTQLSGGTTTTLAPASYVVVRELPATDWGYGGQTQAARRLVTSAPAY